MTTKTEILKKIRQQCLTCCGGSWLEVENCTGGSKTNEFTTCYLHPYRFGTDPQKPSESRQKAGVRLAKAREQKALSKTEATI